jgi:hypothetical protein
MIVTVLGRVAVGAWTRDRPRAEPPSRARLDGEPSTSSAVAPPSKRLHHRNRPAVDTGNAPLSWGVTTLHEEHPMSSQAFDEPLLGSNGQPTATIRHGNTILRPAGPWTPTVHSLLRHLEQVGFSCSPRVVGDGYHDQGREILSYIEARSPTPIPTPTRASARSASC